MFLLGALCYTICTMKAPPQALEGPERSLRGIYHFMAFTEASSPGPGTLEEPGEEASHEDSVLCSMRHEGELPGTLFYATCRRMFNP